MPICRIGTRSALGERVDRHGILGKRLPDMRTGLRVFHSTYGQNERKWQGGMHSQPSV
jgi:hypothetical protein